MLLKHIPPSHKERVECWYSPLPNSVRASTVNFRSAELYFHEFWISLFDTMECDKFMYFYRISLVMAKSYWHSAGKRKSTIVKAFLKYLWFWSFLCLQLSCADGHKTLSNSTDSFEWTLCGFYPGSNVTCTILAENSAGVSPNSSDNTTLPCQSKPKPLMASFLSVRHCCALFHWQSLPPWMVTSKCINQ